MRNEAGQGNEPEIRASDDGSVRILTLNRPDRINAFTAASYRHLAQALNDADADASVSVVLLEGAGQGFSSGVDLAAIGVDDLSLSECFDDLVASLIRFSKPLLAAVHGVAVGFGATILLHCDIVMVADTAKLRFPFTALGTTPEAASSVLLPLLVGTQRAADLLLTSRFITGTEAAQIGLAARCLPEASLHSEARALARELTEMPVAALATAKRLMRHGAADVTRQALDRERAAAIFLHDELGPMGELA